MRYIRKTDDPLKILSFGYVEAGGLGEVPPGFEEVEGPLPEGAMVIERQPVKNVLLALIKQAPLSVRRDLYAAYAAWHNHDTELAASIINASALSDTLKQKILDVL